MKILKQCLHISLITIYIYIYLALSTKKTKGLFFFFSLNFLRLIVLWLKQYREKKEKKLKTKWGIDLYKKKETHLSFLAVVVVVAIKKIQRGCKLLVGTVNFFFSFPNKFLFYFPSKEKSIIYVRIYIIDYYIIFCVINNVGLGFSYEEFFTYVDTDLGCVIWQIP